MGCPILDGPVAYLFWEHFLPLTATAVTVAANHHAIPWMPAMSVPDDCGPAILLTDPAANAALMMSCPVGLGQMPGPVGRWVVPLPP
eukprot:850383-Karenia_brevis.AAC.1